MAIDPVVKDFIARPMAENNRSLMSEISILITNSVESIKRSNSEAVEDQIREIKKIRREEPKSFKRKGNEVQYKFNAKIQDSIDEAKSFLESNAVDKAKQFKNTLNTNWRRTSRMVRKFAAPRKGLEKSLKSVAARKSKKSKVDSLVLLVFHNLPVLHFNAVRLLHLGAIGSRFLHARSRIFLQNLGAVLPAEIWSLEGSMFAGSYFCCF